MLFRFGYLFDFSMVEPNAYAERFMALAVYDAIENSRAPAVESNQFAVRFSSMSYRSSRIGDDFILDQIRPGPYGVDSGKLHT